VTGSNATRTSAPERGGATTISEDVASSLARLILQGDLRDGERLPAEAELGQLLGVSRSVVRDAVRMLVARGLLHVRQGQGTIVSVPDDEAFSEALLALLMRAGTTMGDLIEARAALEERLVALACRRGSSDDWDRMERHLEGMADAVARDDAARIDEEHLAFHVAVYEAMRLPALVIVLRPMQEVILATSPTQDPSVRQRWIASHERILQALRVGDETAAESAVRAHFEDLMTDEYRAYRAELFREAASLDAYRAARRRRTDPGERPLAEAPSLATLIHAVAPRRGVGGSS
jgi:GntR family transcriptional regulator, transcriptional repressor for pyruvate dehydrogenase complex